jgi:hypothetical protein
MNFKEIIAQDRIRISRFARASKSARSFCAADAASTYLQLRPVSFSKATNLAQVMLQSARRWILPDDSPAPTSGLVEARYCSRWREVSAHN